MDYGFDYIDRSGGEADYKKVLLEFTLGYSEEGYLDMCRIVMG